MKRRTLLQQFVCLAALPIGKILAAERRLRLGVHTYSLKHLSLEDALQAIAAAGVSFAETYGWEKDGHLPFTSTPNQIKKVLNLAKKRRLAIPSFGVIGFDADRARSRKIFEFARSLKCEAISADPEYEALNDLDALVAEFGTKIAIHPHGKTHPRYPGWRAIREAIRGRHEHIGVCMDTGNSLLGGDEAVEGMWEMRGRVYDVHLKDVDIATEQSVVLGTGSVDVKGVLRALRDIAYQGPVIIEYELEKHDPLPGLRQSLQYCKDILREEGGNT